MARRKKAEAEAQVATAETMLAFKGFDKDFSCRGHKFEIGKTYTVEGKIVVCKNGFHYCECPFDVWNYYPAHNSRFGIVTPGGEIGQDDGDSKGAATSITIQTELSLPDFIRCGVDWLVSHAKTQTATGYRGHAAATGDCGHAAATGDCGHAAATGYCGHAAATGYRGHAAATGDCGHAAATGYRGHAAATGDCGHAAATGYRGHAAATGYGGRAAATGYRGHAAATGYRGHAAATGDCGHAAVHGKNAIAAALGYAGTVTAGPVGTGVVLAEYDGDWNLIGVRAGLVGKDSLKPGVTYRLKGGEFVEAQ